VGLTACSEVEPYIYKAGEFNRNNPFFAKEPMDISSVNICYNKSSTTPNILLQMATDECTRFGKQAVFVKHETLACTILAPAQAQFACIIKK
jgi:hypothetical protein